MNGLENVLANSIVYRIGWALLHFLWQGVSVAVLLAWVMWVLRRHSANLRYTVACVALSLMLMLPATTILLLGAFGPEALTRETPGLYATAGDVVPEPTGWTDEAAADNSPSSVLLTPIARTKTSRPWHQQTAELLKSSLSWVVCTWLVGVLGLSLWRLRGWMEVQQLRHDGTRPVAETIQQSLSRLFHRFGLYRVIRTSESVLIRVPTVVGWLRPVILLPAQTMMGLTTEQLEAILAHELAHIRRHDYLVNLFQTVAETLLFYHPAVWWVSHRIRMERENCCDDLAVRTVSSQPLVYAQALAAVARISLPYPQLVLAANGGTLLRRIRHILGLPIEQSSRLAIWLAGVFTLLSALAVMMILVLGASCASDGTPEIGSTDKTANSAVTQQTETHRGIAWGKAVDGLQVRLRPERTVWKTGETPTFKLDIRNCGKRIVYYFAAPQSPQIHCEIEYDGQLYRWGHPIGIGGPSSGLNAGQVLYDAFTVELVDSWVHYEKGKARSPDAKRLELIPGRHTVRVMFRPLLAGDMQAVSNPVEIEIQPATTAG